MRVCQDTIPNAGLVNEVNVTVLDGSVRAGVEEVIVREDDDGRGSLREVSGQGGNFMNSQLTGGCHA